MREIVMVKSEMGIVMVIGRPFLAARKVGRRNLRGSIKG